MGKRTKKLGDKSRSKKIKTLIGDYQGSTRRNSSTDGETGSMRERERRDGTKTGPDGSIPQDEET